MYRRGTSSGYPHSPAAPAGTTAKEPAMSPAEWLYYDLLGVVLVFTADVFHLWDPWAAALTRVIERVRSLRSR